MSQAPCRSASSRSARPGMKHRPVAQAVEPHAPAQLSSSRRPSRRPPGSRSPGGRRATSSEVITGGPPRRIRHASRQATTSVSISSPWRRGSAGTRRRAMANGVSNGTQPAATSPNTSAHDSTQRGHPCRRCASSVNPPSSSNQRGTSGCSSAATARPRRRDRLAAARSASTTSPSSSRPSAGPGPGHVEAQVVEADRAAAPRTSSSRACGWSTSSAAPNEGGWASGQPPTAETVSATARRRRVVRRRGVAAELEDVDRAGEAAQLDVAVRGRR